MEAARIKEPPTFRTIKLGGNGLIKHGTKRERIDGVTTKTVITTIKDKVSGCSINSSHHKTNKQTNKTCVSLAQFSLALMNEKI